MAVILANTVLAVRRREHAWGRDRHRKPVATTTLAEPSSFLPGATLERADTGAEQGIEWGLRLDPSLWPVRAGDHVVEEGSDQVWVVTAASLKTVLGYPAVDHVAITAVLEQPEIA